MNVDHWTRFTATAPMHGDGFGAWVRADEAQAEYAALTARVAELEAALGELCAHNYCYGYTDADTGSPLSLYSKVKRARAALAKVTS